MAEVEEPQFTSLAERIAALNKQKNFQAPPPGAGKRAPPPPPPGKPASSVPVANGRTPVAPPPVTNPRTPVVTPPVTNGRTPVAAPPALPRRSASSQNDEASSPAPNGRKLAPPLPSRNSQQSVSPSLPPRRTSTQTLGNRRNSNSSDVSYISTVSNLSLNQNSSTNTSFESLRKLPPSFDQAKLPPLPPTKRELEAKAKETAAQEAAERVVRPAVSRIAEPPRPSLPPRLPSRPAQPGAAVEEDEAPAPALPARRLPPGPANGARAKSALELGFSAARPKPGDDAPPPIPVSSRPTFDQISAVSDRAGLQRSASAPPTTHSCLVCRDFSGPDRLAAQHPRENLPKHDTVGYLAHVLCDPFPSPTDKARAIFTWCHHNMVYDVYGLFNNCIPRGLTPDQQIHSGKAVCEGYARVYESIAKRAGLDCVVVTGHGKGYGYKPLAAGERPPPRDATGHAWNAVRIDGGEWKLLDACWGAGALGAGNQYNQRFAPEMFWLSNDLFGLAHFPENDRHFFRSDNRPPTWEEYVVQGLKGEPVQISGGVSREGISEYSISPREKHVKVHGGPNVVRFQFSKVCEHWTSEKHGEGKPRVFFMSIRGRDGRKDERVCFETDGYWSWVDIPAVELGAPGQTVTLCSLDTLDNKDARGVTKEEFQRAIGRKAMSWNGLATWELA